MFICVFLFLDISRTKEALAWMQQPKSRIAAFDFNGLSIRVQPGGVAGHGAAGTAMAAGSWDNTTSLPGAGIGPSSKSN